MPSPKDPEKFKQYRENMSRISKERGCGKGNIGKICSVATREKMSIIQKSKITPEERIIRSERAKRLGVGKWMKGRLNNPRVGKLATANRGKTYVEIYGEDRAKEQILKRKLILQKVMKKRVCKGVWPSAKFLTSAKVRIGKTYEEIYGEKRAKEEASKRRQAHLKLWENRPRIAGRDKINGESKYTVWRSSVFERDNYICQDCGKKGDMHAHHIKHWATHSELRYELSNGITLCLICHGKRHTENKGLLKIWTKQSLK